MSPGLICSGPSALRVFVVAQNVLLELLPAAVAAAATAARSSSRNSLRQREEGSWRSRAYP